jgi:hypothetical protein
LQSFIALEGLRDRPIYSAENLCSYLIAVEAVFGPDAQRQAIGHIFEALILTFGPNSEIPHDVTTCLLHAYNIPILT